MALRLERLKKQYHGPDGSAVPVIDVESFDLADGEQAALVGGSGTGKTTLLHLIAGILTPDSGRILFGRVHGPEVGARESAAPTPTIGYRSPGGDGVVDVAALGEAERDVFRGMHI